MASTLVKVSIGLTGTTLVGSGATAIYLTTRNKEQEKITEAPQLVQKKKKIKDLFETQKTQQLTDGDSQKWTEKWTSFKGKYETLKENDYWKIDNWDQIKVQDQEGIKLLKQKCTANIEKEVLNEVSQFFIEVKDYCTKTK